MVMGADYGPEAFRKQIGVSRETLERFEIYEKMLRHWQPAINLVSRQSLTDVWRRHFLDSAQLFDLIPRNARSLLDIGSGAGFPGLVLAILGATNVHLVESDQRKSTFLREVSRETATDVTIINARIESISPQVFDVVTSRACAALDVLLNYSRPYLGPETVCLFPKGQSVEEELTTAKKRWHMRYMLVQSTSDSAGKIVRLEGILDGLTTAD
jgi:16S rRNA (guanine527-N7)-methyltransferase